MKPQFLHDNLCGRRMILMNLNDELFFICILIHKDDGKDVVWSTMRT